MAPNSYESGAEEKMLDGGEKGQTSEDTTCGIGCIKGKFLQRFANKKAYVFLYGLLGCVFSATFAYFNGTITTLEKRFKIPSKTTGIISVGNDITTLFVSMFLSYYAGKGHRPRWIAVGIYTVVLFCLMNALPHLLYGPGIDALGLTQEFASIGADDNLTTQDVLDRYNRQTLCHKSEKGIQCETEDGNLAPQIILFLAQLISGIGGSLYYTLGVSYMDDNIKKSKTPVLVSFSYFLRMLGPAMGYTLASVCLKFYISPTLTPRITNNDPRWLGAWWVGWLLLAGIMFITASLLGLFPKILPRAAIRKAQEKTSGSNEKENELPASLHGTVGLVFSACGILISGLVITKFKPRARPLALWNVVVGAISIAGIISYAYLGCFINTQKGVIQGSGELDMTDICNKDCQCDYVKYSPVCAYGQSFTSPCHAGCMNVREMINGSKIYTECACVKNQTDTGLPLPQIAYPGPCPVDCNTKFYIFLAIVCLLKFSGATGRASNFLVAVRCVEEKDKPVAMGFGLMVNSLFAFIPSPILFGFIIDMACMVWGKTCTGTGNCWLYNAEYLRYILNFTSAAFVTIGTFFDIGVWYYVKDLKIFDDEEPEILNLKEKKETESNNKT